MVLNAEYPEMWFSVCLFLPTLYLGRGQPEECMTAWLWVCLFVCVELLSPTVQGQSLLSSFVFLLLSYFLISQFLWFFLLISHCMVVDFSFLPV